MSMESAHRSFILQDISPGKAVYGRNAVSFPSPPNRFYPREMQWLIEFGTSDVTADF